MSYRPHIWRQLRNLTADDLCGALERDGWELDVRRGAERVYRHQDGRRVSVHYHPGKTFGPNLFKALLADIGWSEQDMRRLKLIESDTTLPQALSLREGALQRECSYM